MVCMHCVHAFLETLLDAGAPIPPPGRVLCKGPYSRDPGQHGFFQRWPGASRKFLFRQLLRTRDIVNAAVAESACLECSAI